MDLQDLFPVAVTFVALGVLLTFGLNIQTDVRSDFTANSVEYNASTDAIQGNSNLASKLPILGTILVAAIIIGVLIKSFMVK